MSKEEAPDPWTQLEDDLLLSFVHTSQPGGRCEENWSWSEIGQLLTDEMTAAGIKSSTVYGTGWVSSHYNNFLKPKYEKDAAKPEPFNGVIPLWTPDDIELLLSLVHTSHPSGRSGVYRNWREIALIMTNKAAESGGNGKKYSYHMVYRYYRRRFGLPLVEASSIPPAPAKWTDEEDEILLSLLDTKVFTGGRSEVSRTWKEVSELMGERAAAAKIQLREYSDRIVCQHYSRCIKPRHALPNTAPSFNYEASASSLDRNDG